MLLKTQTCEQFRKKEKKENTNLLSQTNPNLGDLSSGQPCSPHGSTLCISPGQPAWIPGDCHQAAPLKGVPRPLNPRKSKHTRHPTMCQGWLMVLMASDVGLFLGARTSSRFLGSSPPGKGITVTYTGCCCFRG